MANAHPPPARVLSAAKIYFPKIKCYTLCYKLISPLDSTAYPEVTLPLMADAADFERLTPANVPNYRRELKPLPLRVATSQYKRLVETRNRTGISVQEHIRRAIDVYLNLVEREAIELGLMPPPEPNDPPNPTDPVPLKPATSRVNTRPAARRARRTA